jgi:RimJ/RimL family protein N-acetyltransferase
MSGKGDTIMLELRPFEKQDAQIIADWIRDERTYRYWCADTESAYPLSAEALNQWHDQMEAQGDFYEMTACDGSDVVGHIMMRCLDHKTKEFRFGRVIVDDRKRGKGYGQKMLLLALNYAFETLQAEYVTIAVFDDNQPAFACYQKLGFVQEQFLPGCFPFQQEHWGQYILGMTRTAWGCRTKLS